MVRIRRTRSQRDIARDLLAAHGILRLGSLGNVTAELASFLMPQTVRAKKWRGARDAFSNVRNHKKYKFAFPVLLGGAIRQMSAPKGRL